MGGTIAEINGTVAEINRTTAEMRGTVIEMHRTLVEMDGTVAEMIKPHVPSISLIFNLNIIFKILNIPQNKNWINRIFFSCFLWKINCLNFQPGL